jgi:hypothetical protein
MGFGELAPWQWVGAAVAALLVGLSKAGFGAGAGILAVPLMATVLGPSDMLPVMLLVLIIGDVFSVVHYVKAHDRRNLLMLVPGLVAGVAVGSLVLGWFRALPESELWLQRLVGVLSVGFVLLQFGRMARERRLGRPAAAYRPRVWHGVGIGAAAGLTSTLAHAGGPVIALFLLPQQLGRRVFVGTVIKYFFVGNLVKLIPYWRQGLMTAPNAMLSLALLPFVLAGSLAGVYLNRRFSDRAFRLVVYGLAFGFGLYLLSGWRPGGAVKAAGPAPGRSGFAAGLAAYRRGDYVEAAAVFARAVDRGGAEGAAARFNRGLSLYRAGRYASSREALAPLAGSEDAVTTARATFNLGNLDYRQGSFNEAARRYARAVELCLSGLAGQDEDDARVLGELLPRARHNLRIARAMESGEVPAPAEAVARAGQRKQSAPARERPGGAGEAERPTDEADGDAAAPGRGAGARPLEALMAEVTRRDTGPVLDAGPQPRDAPSGKPW